MKCATTACRGHLWVLVYKPPKLQVVVFIIHSLVSSLAINSFHLFYVVRDKNYKD